MPERDAVSLYLGDGFELMAAGIRRERSGDLCADIMLKNGRILFASRAVLNSEEGPEVWAEKATADGRPSALELVEAIRGLLLTEVLAVLQQNPKRPTQSDALVEMVLGRGGDLAKWVAEEAELFHDPNGEAYATIEVGAHQETHALRSKAFRLWLARRYFEEQDKTPSAQALIDATNVLAGRAVFEGPEHPVHVRLAEQRGVIYLDIGDPTWQAIAIDACGWRLMANPPVKFRRPRGMLPLPCPTHGGALSQLRNFLNVESDVDWALLVAWLVGAFRPAGPYPVLALHGEQGSAKSTTSRVLRSLIDPNAAAIRTMPRDERDLMIAATNGWCLAFDNVSSLPAWLSDALCRLATGGGFATRELYADIDETILDAQRPMLLNGITEIATRGDLLDRAIILYLPSIRESRRRTERTFWRAFEEAQPAILGGVLDAISMALRHEATTRLDGYPRMADFARWVVAAEPALPWPVGTFLGAYAANRRAANDLTLEASPVPQALRSFMATRTTWSGTASELLKALDHVIDDQTRRQKAWPSDARALSNALRRLTPNLRLAGLAIQFRREGKQRTRTVVLAKVSDPASAASAEVEDDTSTSRTHGAGPVDTDGTADAADAADAEQEPHSARGTVEHQEDGEWIA